MDHAASVEKTEQTSCMFQSYRKFSKKWLGEYEFLFHT